MKFDLGEQKFLSAKGSFLRERLENESGFVFDGFDDERKKRFELWKKSSGSSGEEGFYKRLKINEITLEKAMEVSGDISWNENSQISRWVFKLSEILEEIPFDLEKEKNGMLLFTDRYENLLKTKEETEFLFPFLYYAEKKLIENIGDKSEFFSKESLSDMSAMLLDGLYNLTYKLFSEKLHIFILRKESFAFLLNLDDCGRKKYKKLFNKHLLSGGWKDLFIEYPVLGRLMVIIIGNWLNNMSDLAVHLSQDAQVLEITKKIDCVKGNISDSHNKGKGVLIIGFGENKQLVYKPRNLDIDIAYNKLVNSLNSKGFPYELKAAHVINFKDHGWIEHIDYKEIESIQSAKDFYLKAGSLLCLIYVLCGNDFHGENIIAHGDTPVLIDLETIISYKMLQLNEENKYIKDVQEYIDIMQESVIGIGFLPIWIRTLEETYIDFGALTGAVRTSIPSFNNEYLSVYDYKENFLEGFKTTYKYFMEKRESLLKDTINPFFSDLTLRVILRATNIYAKMLYLTLKPKFLKDGFLYSVEIEKFSAGYLSGVEYQKMSKIWDMFLYERNSLEERDIPIFYGNANEKNIRNISDVLCDDYFADSAIERINKKIKKLGKSDMERQIDFINESLLIYNKSIVYGKPVEVKNFNINEFKMISRNEILEEAENLYQNIMDACLWLGEKNLSFVNYQYEINKKMIFLGQTNSMLYDGFLGISLFFSALYWMTEKEDYKKIALLIIEPLRERIRDENSGIWINKIPKGMGNGLGGIIKGFTLIGNYVSEKSIHSEVLAVIHKIKREGIIEDKKINFLCGISGLMNSLILAYETLSDDYSLELALECQKKIEKNIDCFEEDNFEYGIKGYIYSALNLNRDLNHEFRGYSKVKIINEELKNIFAHDSLKNEELDQDQLHWGNCGKIDFLIEKSLLENDEYPFIEAEKYIGLMLERKKNKGSYNIDGINSNAISNPSIFQGLSGIGYEFLRYLNPEKIKSLYF